MATMWMTEKIIQNAVFPLPKTCRPRARLRGTKEAAPQPTLPLEELGEMGGAGPPVVQGRSNALLQEVERMEREEREGVEGVEMEGVERVEWVERVEMEGVERMEREERGGRVEREEREERGKREGLERMEREEREERGHVCTCRHIAGSGLTTPSTEKKMTTARHA